MNYHLAPGLKKRMITILALIGIGAGGIIARAVQLQILDAPRLQALAKRQHQNTIELKAKRGDILDGNGEPLAVSQKKAHVYALPEHVNSAIKTAQKLAPILGLDPKSLMAKLTGRDNFVWLARYISFEQAEAIAALKLSGIDLLPASTRHYPGGALAANVIGFTRRDDVGQGLEGLEYRYEEMLAGSTIRIWQERDGLDRPIFLSDRGPSFNFRMGEGVSEKSFASLFQVEAKGNSLELTILRPLQYVAERELEKGIQAAGASGGCVVIMEPQTGKVLAMASYPTFDPNRFNEYNQADFRNRCVVNTYEPGSTFKVFVVAAALEEGLVKPNEKIDCENGSYVIGGETISDTKAHGVLAIADIIALSSNIGAGKIGERLGRDRLYEAVKAFGFGDRTGIDFPGESGGLLRPARQWSPVAVGTVSFGQGISVTPLQMVTALSALANDGVMMAPYLVEKVIKPDGTAVTWQEPRIIRRIVSPATTRIVTEFMKKVVSPGGTGMGAAVPGYTVAGKTGTAQQTMEKVRGYVEGKYVASFMGFLPASRPRLAMIVVIDEPNPDQAWGGMVAAPVFQAIAKQAMILLKVPSEQQAPAIAQVALPPESEGAAAARIRSWEAAREWKLTPLQQNPGGDIIMPDLTGLTLRQALQTLAPVPSQVEIAGTGSVAGQSPAAGSVIRGPIAVRLKLAVLP